MAHRAAEILSERSYRRSSRRNADPAGVHFQPLYRSGRTERGRVITVFQDISEIKKLQFELKTREKLVTLGGLAGEIAHEIKNPLFSISAGIQALQEEIELDDAQKEQFNSLFRETVRVNRLVMQLLEYSARPDLDLSRCQISTLIEEVVLVNQNYAKSMGIEIDYKPPANLPLLMLDEDKMIQVLTNLLHNAVEASKEGGVVTIDCSLGEKRSKSVFVRVMDRGAGVSANLQEKLFDLFYTTKDGGAGMGLAITKKIVLEHGGMIWAEFREGGGMSFVTRLPLEDCDA